MMILFNIQLNGLRVKGLGNRGVPILQDARNLGSFASNNGIGQTYCRRIFKNDINDWYIFPELYLLP